MEIIACIVVGFYLVAAFYGLATNLTGKHVLTRTWAARAHVAAVAAVWPAETSWQLLRLYVLWLRRTWQAAEPRWQEVAS